MFTDGKEADLPMTIEKSTLESFVRCILYEDLKFKFVVVRQ